VSNSPLRCSSHRRSSSCRGSVAVGASGRFLFSSLLLRGDLDLDPPSEVLYGPTAGHVIALHDQLGIPVRQAAPVERPDQIGLLRASARPLHFPEDFLSLDLPDPEDVVAAQRRASCPPDPRHLSTPALRLARLF